MPRKIEVIVPQSERHAPAVEIVDGKPCPYPELAQRLGVLSQALQQLEQTHLTQGARLSMDYFNQIHAAGMLDTLRRLSQQATEDEYLVPFLFPRTLRESVENLDVLFGYYSFETATPVGRWTFDAAQAAASAAVTAAMRVEDGAPLSYALSRPPGHHAEKAKMGGYCYINSAAAAAHYLTKNGRVAVLDIDVHHANGTQDIFYDRSDVLVTSIHGHPDKMYPYFSGYADETGEGQGKDYTINLPIDPELGGDERYRQVLSEAIYQIHSYKPEFLVVSIGYDAHEADKIGNLQLSTPFYQELGQTLGKMGYPTVLVQEGGYNLETIGGLAQRLVSGFIESIGEDL